MSALGGSYDNVPGLMNLDKAVFTFSEVAYSEGHKLADLC
jgi:hypothetical protein